MGFFSLFNHITDSSKGKPRVPEVIPAILCPACGKELIKIKQKDGVYCQECGELLSIYTARVVKEAHRYYEHNLPQRYGFDCSRCYSNMSPLSSPDYKHYTTEETTLKCYCGATLHCPSGFCVTCWQKLANNGRCINSKCGRYKEPEQARMIPIYEADVPSPHCPSCGKPFIVFNEKVSNRDIAQVALGPNGYEWISKDHGCSGCGHVFEPSKK